ncbi:MAG TPA: PA2779 family protein [Thermodesulfovibrionales bacterium]|nr:PA2779 family protein [Thermodesulfovibrionales bacterium]
MSIPFMKQISWYLVIAMFVIGIAPRVDAGLAPSEIIALSQTDRAADLEKIQKVLELKAVSQRMTQLGLAQEEIKSRLDQLSDQQIHQTAVQLDDLKVGQGDALGLVIALLVIAILLVILLNLTGRRVFITK